MRPRSTNTVRQQSKLSLSEWCTQTARDVRSGSSVHDIVNNGFPIALQGRGTLADRLQRSLASTDHSDERLILWATYSVLVFGIPAGAAFDRTAERLRMREQLRHDRALHAAPARLSARSLTALPVAILILLTVTSEDVRTFVQTPIGMLIVFVGCVLNEFGRRAMRAVIEPSSRRRHSALSQDLTDTLEGISLVVMAGVPLRTVLMSSSTIVTVTLRPTFEQMAFDLADGALLVDALEQLRYNVGEHDQFVIHTVIEGQRNGSPMSQTLSNLVDNIDRRREREEAQYVRTLPVRLAGPLVGLTLPAFVCLAVLPPLASSLAGLSTSPLSSL